MAKEERSVHAPEEGGSAVELLGRLQGRARQTVRELRLPGDWADDLAQAAWASLFREETGPICDEALTRAVQRLANRECQRRRRETRSRAVPPDREGFLRTLCAAARGVATQPRLLTDRQLRVFVLAYVEGLGLEELTRLIGAPTLRAARDRLYRISRRIEKELLRSLRPLLNPRNRARFLDLVGPKSREPAFAPEKNELHISDGLAELCDDVLSGLRVRNRIKLPYR